GVAFRLLALILVVERGGDRMVGVVDLLHEVRNRKLELVGPKPSGLVFRRETVPRAEIEQDVGGLGDQELAGLEERRRKRRMVLPFAFEHRNDRVVAALARDVDIVSARLFEREPDVFAAALDLGPVVELVAHGLPPCRTTLPRIPPTLHARLSV